MSQNQFPDVTAILAANEDGEIRARNALLERQNEIYGDFLSRINGITEERRGEIAASCQGAIGDVGRQLRGEMKTHSERSPSFYLCYRHYKNGRLYRLSGFAKDVSTKSREVIIYHDIETQFAYVRDSEEFFAYVEHEGQQVRRFAAVGGSDEVETVTATVTLSAG